MGSGEVAAISGPRMNGPADVGRSIDPRPLVAASGRWTRVAGPVASILILGAVAYQLRMTDWRSVPRLIPVSAPFWVAFVAYYLAGPVSEWLIFRRLWSLPARGLLALLRKLVSNEMLLGYLGEVYFYAWARRNGRIVAAPFGAIKDVTILSAVVGNGFALAMMLLAWPFLRLLSPGSDNIALVASISVVLLSSAAAMLFRRRLFTLPRAELWRIAGIHALRIVATTALAAVMWHLLLPSVALGWWLVLGTARQLLSRLPLLPNKDVVFAGLAAFLVGSDGQIAAAMALMASLLLLAHMLVGCSLAAAELAAEPER